MVLESAREARDERTKARALVKQGSTRRQFGRIKGEQEDATTFEAVAREWLALPARHLL